MASRGARLSSKDLELRVVSSSNVVRPGLDIVFVHGLGGDANSTWSPPGASDAFWPPWLAEDLSDVRVSTLGYPAEATRWTSQGTGMALPDRAASVADFLSAHRLGGSPIVFVAHSLGGLLVKQLLRISEELNIANVQPFHRHTKAVVFLATPHSGSDLATFAQALPIVRATETARDLRAHSPYLRDLGHWYSNNAIRLGIRTAAYFETQAFHGITVVDPTSADPRVISCLPIPVDADHFEIAKPRSRDAAVYRGVLAFLRDSHATADENPADRPDNAVFAKIGEGAWPRTALSLDTVYEGVGETLGRARRSWLKGRFQEQLHGLLTELALNAFHHGQAAKCEVAVYERTIVFSDDGAPFDVLAAKPTRRDGRVGGGLFALHDFLGHSEPRVEAVYTALRESWERSGSANEVLFVVQGSEIPVDPETGYCVISLRRPICRPQLERREISHQFDIPHGCSHYLLDLDSVEARIIRVVMSLFASLIRLLVARLPLGSLLHIRVRDKDQLQRYVEAYSDLADRIQFEKAQPQAGKE